MRRLVCLSTMLLFLLSGHLWAAETLPPPARRLAALYEYSLFLDKAGTMWGWGGGSSEPKLESQGVTAMAAGIRTIYIIKENAELWGSGDSSYGQLGVISKEIAADYVKILTNVQAVAAARGAVYALKKDNTLWGWGRDNSYEKHTRKKPEKILDKVTQVAAGAYHTLALREDGTLWSWGSNLCGRLGTQENIRSRTRPGKVDMEALEGRAVINIAVRDSESFAVTEDGLVWRWGSDDPKCDYFPPEPSIPERLPFIDNVRQIAVGFYSSYTLALKNDGTVWAWGITGRLGLPEGRWNTPRQLLEDMEEIALGDRHALALKKDGTVWAWGDNNYGQLGPERGAFDYTPRQVSIPSAGTKK